MRKGDVMRAVVGVLLGCAGGAPGRDVPVYREYTQPILFYDEQGDLLVFNAAAPDLAALQSMHDSQAQATMLGKETILEMAFGSGASVFARPAPISGKLSPTADGGEDNPRRRDESGQNWLAKSLSLPSLGQTPDSAAATAMEAGARESGWGWLAGELAGQSDREGILPGGGQAEPDMASAGRNTTSNQNYGGELGRNDSASAGRNEMSSLNPSAAIQALPEGMHSYRSDSAAAEMSQTRKMLSEFSTQTRPDYDSRSATFATASAGGPPGANSSPANRLSLDATSSAGPSAAWGHWESRSSSGANSRPSASPGIRSWRGGWSAQGSEGSVMSRIETLPETAPVVEDPITTYINSRPRTSSGGYKPAWF